ncbi:dynein regulatory complex subunit 3 [Lampris incognitus]|uniref:dynein regulatory complex subunit 3 n=1 Tax=Lampris incognitus TaxID=2546036 RepID=UPI0024B5711B|nr:dynein regulatory complex subunit 3 [Lampris incognitus]
MAEHRVIDEEMLMRALEEQGPQEEGVQFDEVLHLRLEYERILKIDHLWEFTSLTKLQLNNNHIMQIAKLGHLVNLSWLDLSFNNIEKIEGLETLVKLEDLNLGNNRISAVENMDTLENLTFFSVGNNSLGQLDHVIYLRRLKNLHTLILAGNPISKDENYKLFIAAYFPELVYLDYKLLDGQTKEQALDKYRTAVEQTKYNELQVQKASEAKQIQQDELQLHMDAFVEFLNGSYLFDSMFTEDADTKKLAFLPEVTDLLQAYERRMGELCVQMCEIGLVEHQLRETEVKCFFDGFKEAVADNRQGAAQTKANFEQHREKTLLELRQVSDTHFLEAQLKKYSEEIAKLYDSLMTLELQLVDQLEELTRDFDTNISAMVGGFIKKVKDLFTQCRNLENNHSEQLQEAALANLQKVLKNEHELDDDMPDDLRTLLVDTETVINAVSSAHNSHLLRINNREDELVTRVNAWMGSLTEEIRTEQIQRHGKRISEILNYVDHLEDGLEEFRQHDT